MSTRSFLHIQLSHALPVLVLCALLAGSASADRGNAKRGGDSRNATSHSQVKKADNAVDRDNDRARDKTGSKKSQDKKVRRTEPSERSKSDYKERRSNRDASSTSVKRQYTNSNNLSTRRAISSLKKIQRAYKTPKLTQRVYYYSERPHYKPAHYAHWVFNSCDRLISRRSVYYHFGFFPYLRVSRIHIDPYVVISYRSTPVIVRHGYYLSSANHLDAALSDIRYAWINGRFDLIQDHIDSSRRIAILLDGSYDYSIDSDDYAQMTCDAIDQMETISFSWESIRERNDGVYTAFAKHRFLDRSGLVQTVYVSYTLRKLGGDYIIVEVGSSLVRV